MGIYFKIPEFLRYLIVYVITGILYYLFYVAMVVNLFHRDYFILSTIASFIFPVTLAYCMMKLFVFRTSSGLLVEYIKTVIVYFLGFLINTFLFIVFYKFASLDFKFVQITNMLIIFIFTYWGLKKFAFNPNLIRFR